mgnify:FL=1
MTESKGCVELNPTNELNLSEEDLSFLMELGSEMENFLCEEPLFDLAKLNAFKVRKKIIADHLKSIIVHNGFNQNSLSELLGWKTSRMSKVLSGDSNLTLKTIFDICKALDFDFDIVFFNKNYSRPFFQPWEYSIEQYSNHPLDEYNIDIIPEKDIYNYLNYSRDKNIRGFFSIYSKSKLIDVHPEYVEIENQPSNSYSFDLNFTK